MNELEDLARTELATAMVPWPEDLLADIGPLGQMVYLNQLAWHVFRSLRGMLSTDASIELQAGDPPVVALNQLMEAIGMIDQVCVTLDLIPIEQAV